MVKTGIYKYIRHPQYTGFMLLTVGMILEWQIVKKLNTTVKTIYFQKQEDGKIYKMICFQRGRI